MKKLIHCLFLTFVFLLVCIVGNAHHYRGGQITYQYVSGYTYEFTVTMFLITSSPATVQRIQSGLSISWGDNTTSNIPCIETENLPDNYTKSIFMMRHTFPGPGVYSVFVEEPGRDAVVNISNLVTVGFSIKTIFRIDPNTGHNNSPQLLTDPIFKATLGQQFVHNPSAFDVDGDSLSYELAIPTGIRGVEIGTYSHPEASKDLYVDPITGDLIWNAPIKTGAYVIAIRINEWRYGIKISSIIREMKIDVCLGENVLTTTDVAMTEKESIKVYPNPTDNMIHFRLDTTSIVKLYDSMGRLILSQRYEAGVVVINIGQQPAGIYFLKVENQTVKIIKNK